MPNFHTSLVKIDKFSGSAHQRRVRKRSAKRLLDTMYQAFSSHVKEAASRTGFLRKLMDKGV